MKNKTKLEQMIKIPKEEYYELEVYKKHCSAVMKFLAMNHHDIYMSVMNNLIDEVEERINELMEEIK